MNSELVIRGTKELAAESGMSPATVLRSIKTGRLKRLVDQGIIWKDNDHSSPWKCLRKHAPLLRSSQA